MDVTFDLLGLAKWSLTLSEPDDVRIRKYNLDTLMAAGQPQRNDIKTLGYLRSMSVYLYVCLSINVGTISKI